MPDPEKDLEARLSRVDRELEQLKDGLRLLGIRQCNHCRKFFLSQDGKTLFEGDELVCYSCVQDWWHEHAAALNTEQRQAIEHKLMRWLIAHHNAKVIRQPEKMPRPEELELKMVVGCEQCNGTGKTEAGKRCSYCDGRGFVWVVVLWPQFQ
jgi:hypothetical protein